MHRMGLHSGVFCLVPRRRFSAGKQGARGVVGRMQNVQRLQCIYPTTPRAPSYNKEGSLGDEAGVSVNLEVLMLTLTPHEPVTHKRAEDPN